MLNSIKKNKSHIRLLYLIDSACALNKITILRKHVFMCSQTTYCTSFLTTREQTIKEDEIENNLQCRTD